MVSNLSNIINDLATDLKARVEAVIQLTEQREDLEAKLDHAKRELKKVKIALEALSGNDIPVRVELDSPQSDNPVPASEPQRAAPEPSPVLPAPAHTPPVDPRPICNSCQSGRMNY